MIFTRMGSPVRVIGLAADYPASGFVLVEYQEDGDTREVHVGDLRADNGAAEIDEAIRCLAGRG
jgi:hypothetical protein